MPATAVHDGTTCEACQETARRWPDPWDLALRRLVEGS